MVHCFHQSNSENPRRVVDETWLTPVFESLVRRGRRSPWCGSWLRVTSSPSAILYRFKINSPLTSNAAAALSTSREPARHRQVLAPPSVCASSSSPPHALPRPAPRRRRSASSLLACLPAPRFSQASTSGRNWAATPTATFSHSHRPKVRTTPPERCVIAGLSREPSPSFPIQ